MEISTRLHSYISLKPSFSDQSHLAFYGCSSSTRCKPITSHLQTDLASSSPPVSLHAATVAATHPPLQSACQPSLCAMGADSSIPTEFDLHKELAVLKAQVKLKKKQLQALVKERKTALKRKNTKEKGASSSSSSSSSTSSLDSSDGGSMAAVNMRLLKKGSSQNREEGGLKHGVSVRGESHADVDHTDRQQYRNEDITQCMPSKNESHGSSSIVYLQSTRSSDHALQGFRDTTVSGQGFRDEAIAGPLHGALGAAISGSIEVCMGGKCKKAGSQQLLSSFNAQIPASACVVASPCKCMGKCGAAINVKVRKEDTNPQHHSHVSVDDVGLILSHHFGLGPPLPGLPRFSSLSPSTPSPCTAHV